MTAGPPPTDGVIVALGSNMGDSVAILRRALADLEGLSAGCFAASSFWRSSPVDCPAGSPDFVNAVCRWLPRSLTTPESLLDQLQALERGFGRTGKKILNEPRSLDLDLIAFGQVVRSDPRLTLPHPRAHQRRFVLAPLQEIAPNLRLPGWPLPVAGMLAALGPDPGDTVRMPG